MEEIRADKTLDIKGIHAPRLQELTMSILEKMYAGQILRVITDDLSTRTTIPSLCRTGGHVLLDMGEDEGALYYTIQK